jgi:hypothetical protein
MRDSLIRRQNLITFGAINLILIRKLFKSNYRQSFGVSNFGRIFESLRIMLIELTNGKWVIYLPCLSI